MDQNQKKTISMCNNATVEDLSLIFPDMEQEELDRLFVDCKKIASIIIDFAEKEIVN